MNSQKKNKKNTLIKLFWTVFIVIFLTIPFRTIAEEQPAPPHLGISQTSAVKQATSNQVLASPNQDENSCSWNPFTGTPTKCMLLIILGAVGYLVSLAATIFAAVIDAKNLTSIINNESIYLSWKTVRDFLNIAFILFLLFSAFCTIFQIKKYSYKSTLLNVVLMALLVNFSFPITRFIIDVSNSLMYTILNITQIVPGDFLAGVAKEASIHNIIHPPNIKNAGYTELIMGIIFLFILGTTFLVMAVLFVIRIVALAILIIFSPIAFTGTIIPGVSDKASSWWTQLFNYAFFGPIMVFMLYVAIAVMNATKGINITGDNSISSLIVPMSRFTIPIIILWMGMGMAKSMSIAGAGAVTGYAEGKLKGMGKWVGTAPYKAAGWGFKKTGIPGGIKQRWENQKKFGKWVGTNSVEKREARWAEKSITGKGKGWYGVEGAVNEHSRKGANAVLDDWKKNGAPSEDELKKIIDENKDNIRARAAAMRLAEDTGLGGDYVAYEKVIDKIMNGDQSAIDTFHDKLKKKGRDLIIARKITAEKDKNGKPNTLTLQDELAKLGNADFGGINFENLAKNTTSASDGRGGKEALNNFFKNISLDRKIQIARNINPKNQAYLEKKTIFKIKDQEEKEKKPIGFTR